MAHKYTVQCVALAPSTKTKPLHGKNAPGWKAPAPSPKYPGFGYLGEGWEGGKIHPMPARRTTPTGYDRAHALRKQLTPAERKLWAALRGDQMNGVNFRRQHAIGPFIADFCAVKEKLIIELDGSQHLEQAEYDVERTQYLEARGYKVMRFWNNQVTNDLPGVIIAIIYNLEDNRTGKL